MGNPEEETIWSIEPHTQAKHELLTRYLEAWFPIMASWNAKVLFLDGFAGPGRYKGGEPGSPLLAIGSAKKHESIIKSDVLFFFNEADPERHAELANNIKELEAGGLPANFYPHLADVGEFRDFAQGIVDDRGDRRLVPTFAFVDPFGWKGVPMELIANLVRDQRSELFILFSYNRVNNFLTAPLQQNNMRELFGCDDYLQARGMAADHRKEFLASLYERQLREFGKFLHISRFEMIERNNRTSYFLYHCTRSIKGLEVMRSAMWKIDPTNGCSFSDAVVGLESLFGDGPLVFDLEERLIAQFSGKRVPIKEIQNFVLTGTRYAPGHLKVKVLKPMQERGLITVHNQKRRGTFPDGVEVEFVV